MTIPAAHPAGFIFAHPGAFGEQALKLVGSEFLAQQRLQARWARASLRPRDI